MKLRPTWTEERPTTPGFYWRCSPIPSLSGAWTAPLAVELLWNGNWQTMPGNHFSPAQGDLFWEEPIYPPKGKLPMPDKYGRRWDLPSEELCPACGQPDSCGDCNHARLTDDEVRQLGGELPS